MDVLKNTKQPWHSMSAEVVFRHLKSSKEGLSEEEVNSRLRIFGLNKLPEEKPVSKIGIFIQQFKSPLIYILFIAGIITLLLEDWTDAVVIFAAVFLNSFIGYFQENKTSQILSKLKKAIHDKAIVIRSGQEKEILQQQLITGDIIVLRGGDKIPADARLIETSSLRINESSLTGEWLAVDKTEKVLVEGISLADRKNMVYMGTMAESGRGKAVVIGTGVNTEIGKIAVSIKKIEKEKTPYQKKIISFSKIIAILVGIATVIIFLTGILSGRDPLEMFITGVAVAVAAVPEGLPIAITVILARGMERILRKRGLVRKLVAAEVLGSTSVICTDKTGTLTEAKMQVTNVFADNRKFPYELALKIGMLCSEAFVENVYDPMHKWIIRGRATEKAVLLAALQSGLRRERIEKEEPRIDILPFEPTYKYSVSLHKFSKTQDIIYILGAPEIILNKSKYFETEQGRKELTNTEKETLTKKYENLNSQGLRLIATAYRKISNASLGGDFKRQSELDGASETERKNIYEKYLEEMVFVAFLAIKDPLRKEVKEAIKTCREAGMRPIIITGDHPLTAKAIAKELNIFAESKNIIDGVEFEKLSDKDFKKRLKEINIYARMEPHQKLRIVDAWQKEGKIVAMTGDGINDAPALKKANIGLALGSGTDVAKEASDLILLTDNFSIIVAAVKEGRGIVDNIRKTVTLQVSQCFSEIILIGTSIIAGLPLPILPAQILWENLIEGSPQGIALAFEKQEKDIMERKPENPHGALLNAEMKTIIFGFGIITGLILLGLFLWLLKKSIPIIEIRTIIFAALAVDSIFYAFSCKNLKKNIWHYNPFSNSYLLGAMSFSIIMLLLAIYIPLFQNILKTMPLNLFDWSLIIGLGIMNLVLIEIIKLFFIKFKKLK